LASSGGKGKRKGSAFEREICVALSLWVSAGKKKDLFWRSAMSGGRATTHRKNTNTEIRQGGDICSVAPEGHIFTDKFYIECKNYKSLDIQQFCVTSKGILAEFWADTVFKAEECNKAPVLIGRENRFPTIVLTLPKRPLLPNCASCLTQSQVMGSYPALVYLFNNILKRPFGDVLITI